MYSTTTDSQQQKSNDEIRIRAFRAIDDPESCDAFIEGHMDILRHFNVTMITSAKHKWKANPNVFVIVAESNDGKKTLGGVRVHCYNDNHPLPLEDAVGDVDKNVSKFVQKYAVHGTAEACGQWNSHEVRGMGVSRVLIRSAVVICEQLGLHSLFGFSSDHTMPIFRRVGYKIVHSLGDEGDFVYPTPEYIARVIVMDPLSLEDVLDEEKEKIKSLRDQLKQSTTESGKDKKFKVNYDLYLQKNANILDWKVPEDEDYDDDAAAPGQTA